MLAKGGVDTVFLMFQASPWWDWWLRPE